MKNSRKKVIAAAFALVLAFLFLVPIVGYAMPDGTFSCPPNGCNFLRYGSVTYWGLGVGGTSWDVTGYSISVAPGSTTASSTTITSYTVSVQPTQTTTVILNSSDDLQLQLSLNASSSSASGVNISVSADDYNTLASTNNVTVADNWPVTLNGLDFYPCWPNDEPVGLAVASGYYSSSNITTAKFLDLVKPGQYNCPSYPYVKGYVFQPADDRAATYGCRAIQCSTEKISGSVTITGYWNQGGTFVSLPRGTYTVAAEDEWGDLVTAYFVVS